MWKAAWRRQRKSGTTKETHSLPAGDLEVLDVAVNPLTCVRIHHDNPLHTQKPPPQQYEATMAQGLVLRNHSLSLVHSQWGLISCSASNRHRHAVGCLDGGTKRSTPWSRERKARHKTLKFVLGVKRQQTGWV